MDERKQAELEFWFDFASNYSYLSVMRMRQLASSAEVAVRWRPFLLGPIFKSLGWENSPFVLQKEKGAYMWQDMVRECRKYAVPWQQPTEFPRRSILPVRIALYGAEQPWIQAFCERVMLRNFSADLDINTEPSMTEVLASLDLDAAAIIAASQSEQNKRNLYAQTDLARARGVFGAPTFFVGDEMFWGNDRLDDAIAAARSSLRD